MAAMSNKRDDFDCPDVVTASADYQRRFDGHVGQYLLEVQRKVIFDLLDSIGKSPLRILELGGAHGQLTRSLLEAGHQVVVQCSKPEGFERLSQVQDEFPDRLELVACPPQQLPYDNAEFDMVIMVRLISHLENWAEVLKECTRLSKGNIIFDYPTALSFNFFSPLLFNLKKRIEGNTRRYTVFTERRLRRELDSCGFKISRRARQFFLPMALHRLCDCPKLSIGVEGLSKVSGLTKHFGSPAVLLAQKEVLNRPAQ